MQVSWPISDILRVHTNEVYQQILTFLLQIQRTKYLLEFISTISRRRERRRLKGDVRIVHVVRLELIWFVNLLLHYLGIVVLPLEIHTESGYSTNIVCHERKVTRVS